MTNNTRSPRRDWQPPSLDDLLNESDETDVPASASESIARTNEHTARRPTSADFANGFADTAPDNGYRRRPSDGEYMGTDFATTLFAEKGKRKPKTSSRLAYAPSRSERRWASLAHAAAIATIIAGIGSAGVLALFLLTIPLGIYFYWRTRSEFVAYQALQAFAFQALGTVGWLILLIGGALAGVLVTALLVIFVVTIPLLIIFVPLFALYLVGVIALPFITLFYSMVAAFQTARGFDYRIPWVGRWIEHQLSNGFMSRL